MQLDLKKFRTFAGDCASARARACPRSLATCPLDPESNAIAIDNMSVSTASLDVIVLELCECMSRCNRPRCLPPLAELATAPAAWKFRLAG